MIIPRITKEIDLPDGWYWDGDNLGITEEQLKKRPLSVSSAKLFRNSPRHYANKMIFGGKPSTEDQLLGKITETLALEKENFDKTFKVWEKATGTGSVKINNEAKLTAASKKLTLITKDQLRRGQFATESLMDHNEARQLIENKKNVQKKLTWTDKATKLPLLGYIDFESEVWESDWIVDLKTGPITDPDDMDRVIYNMEWHLQGAMYLEGYHQKYYKFPGFLFLFVETKEPYNVVLKPFESKEIELSKDELKGTFLAFKKCFDHKLFNEGYEFRLMETRSYFSVKRPGYYKPKYGGLK